jgi:formylglycine-generating enzyme required for sulfatase activity
LAEVALPEVALTPAARRRALTAYGAQCNSGAPGRGQHPMNCVTYEEAESYCKWRGGKLPSEGEWEFAAQGVNGRPFPWGSASPSPALVNACGSECKSWYGAFGLQAAFDGVMYDGSDGYAGTAPVGSFPGGATPDGIYDLLGNVAEWTSARVAVYDDDPGEDAVAASHVVRGGAFTSSLTALAPPVLRLYLGAGERDRSVGFRCSFSR